MTIRETLARRIAEWEIVGHHALLERFVLRNGKVFKGRKRIGRKRKEKECFRNAHNFVLHATDPDTRYVEGYTMIPEMDWLVHHAWVTTDGTDAMDPTIDAMTHEYFGIEFTKLEANKIILKHGYYGLFDGGYGLNTDLIFAMDPELEGIIKNIKRPANDEERDARIAALAALEKTE